jgi:hypothetical protein
MDYLREAKLAGWPKISDDGEALAGRPDGCSRDLDVRGHVDVYQGSRRHPLLTIAG